MITDINHNFGAALLPTLLLRPSADPDQRFTDSNVVLIIIEEELEEVW